MKKRKQVMVLSLLILSMVSIFTGCNKNKKDDLQDQQVDNIMSPDNTEKKKHKVTFYDQDGTTELSMEEVEDGGLATEFTPEKDNLIFMGWFATPSLSHNFDFTHPINEETKVFAGFLENQEDTRSFAIVGSGRSPVLLTSNWGSEINDEHMLLKSSDYNTYEITIDLFEDDEFQFAINSSWHNQRGAGYMAVTSLDGIDYFYNSGGTYSNDTKKSNIKCVKSGNYTLTLTTYPGADYYTEDDEYYSEDNREGFNMNPYDTITWVYNGEVKEIGESNEGTVDLQVTYYIKGAKITQWQDLYDASYEFTEADGIHTLTIDLEEGDEFLFTTLVGEGDKATVGTEYVRYSNITDESSLTFIEGNDSYNMITKATGSYTFTYNPNTTELLVSFDAN